MTEEQFNRLINRVAGGNGGGRRPPTLDKTDPVAFKTWRSNFTTVATINEWDVNRSKREARAALTDEAAVLAHDIDIRAGDNAFTLEALMAAYEARFISPAASALAVSEYQIAKQEQLEPAVKFHSRLRGLFVRAYPHNQEDHNNNQDLIRHFIQRLRSGDTQMHCFTQNPATYAAALTAAQMHESAVLMRKASKDMVGSLDQPEGTADSVNAFNGKPNSNLTCWFKPCSGPHMAHNCPMVKEA